MPGNDFTAGKIILNHEGCWPDLTPENVIDSQQFEIALIPNGTAKGLPAVALRIDLPEGKIVIVKTTLRIYCAAAQAFLARCPEVRNVP